MALPITKGAKRGAVKAVVYGIEGVGKTTFAAKFPGAIFIDCEGGTKLYDVARMPEPRTWDMLIEEIEDAAENPDEVGTLVIDTADAAERLCKAHILDRDKKESIESYGFGKGYTILAEEFAKLLEALDKCVAAGVNALVVAHCQIKKFEQPDEMGAYDRYELKLEKKCAPLLKEWCDLLLFANYKTYVMYDENDKNKAKASGGTERVMYTQRRAAWDAKNRFGLEDKLPFEFESIEGAVFGDKTPESAPSEAPKADANVLDGVKIEDVTPENVKKLHRLMERDGITEVMLAHAVAENPKNDYTEDSRIADYSERFTDSLVKHWDSVSEKARKFGAYGQDEIPF